MAKVLISLVSRQRIPNVLAIMDPFFSDIDYYLFITSIRMEHAHVVNHILEATGIGDDKYKKLVVQSHSWQNIQECLVNEGLSRSDSYYVNLTGGTKIMPLAIFSFFNTGGWQVKYFYLPIARNVIQQIFQDRPNIEIPISFRISVKEYLVSYGLTIEAGNFNIISKPHLVSQKILNFYLLQKSGSGVKTQFWNLTRLLRNSTDVDEGIYLRNLPGLSDLIKSLGMPLNENDFVNFSEIKYLTGGWFEEWIYEETKQTLQLSGNEIGRNIVINWLGENQEHGRNELDVVFIYDNIIHIVECKTGLGKKQKAVSEQFTRTLNQLAVFGKEMGLRLKLIFLTLSMQLRETNGGLKEWYKARANFLDVTVIDREDMQSKYGAYLRQLK